MAMNEDGSEVRVLNLDSDDLPQNTKILPITEALAHVIGWRDSLKLAQYHIGEILESNEAVVDTPKVWDNMPEEHQAYILDALRTSKGDIQQLNQMIKEADQAFKRILAEMDAHSVIMYRARKLVEERNGGRGKPSPSATDH